MAQTNLIGQEILGYKVTENFRAGAFGTVYKVVKTNVAGQYVRALKHIALPTEKQYYTILNSMGGDISKVDYYFAKMLKIIVSEINILNDLSEKGGQYIVRYYENDIRETASPKRYDIYILMEYLTPLEEYMQNKEVCVRDVIKLGKNVLTGLKTCHDNGIIHRDIKDDNIFVSEQGEYKIGDFGVSKVLKGSSKAESLKGTPNYIAPEVYLGRESYTKSVDLYSLGIVLYRLLNYNRNPFLPHYPELFDDDSENIAFEKRMKGEIPDLPSLGGECVGNAIIKALLNRNERYPTAEEFLSALEFAEENTPIDILEGKINFYNTSIGERLENYSVNKYQETQGEGFELTSEEEEERKGNRSINKHLFETVGDISDNDVIEELDDTMADEYKTRSVSKPTPLPKTQPDSVSVPVPISETGKKWLIPVAVVAFVVIIIGCIMMQGMSQKEENAVKSEANGTEMYTNSSNEIIKVEWSDWLYELPEYVTDEAYDIEEQTLYRTKSLEKTSSTTENKLDGWELYDIVEGDGEFGEWSDWSATEVISSDTREVESQIRYRYREQETITNSEPSMDGWELYDTIYSWSDYSNWSDWSSTAVSNSDSRKVETKTQYSYRDKSISQQYGNWGSWGSWQDNRESTNDLKKEESRTVWGYYYFQCPSCGVHMHGWGITCPTWAGGCGSANIPHGSWHEIWNVTSWDRAGLKEWHGTGKYYTYIDGELVFRWNEGGSKNQYRYATRSLNDVISYTNWSEYSDTEYYTSETREVRTRTLYRYCERKKEETYYLRRWGDWSNWSTSEVLENDEQEVETAIYYRYRDKMSTKTYYFQRWTDWTEYTTTKATASEYLQVETKQQYRFKIKAD